MVSMFFRHVFIKYVCIKVFNYSQDNIYCFNNNDDDVDGGPGMVISVEFVEWAETTLIIPPSLHISHEVRKNHPPTFSF